MAVYAVFFSIQFFYNFDGHPKAQNALQYSSSANYVGNGLDAVKGGPIRSSTPVSHTIRLNKHFHQADISPCTVFSVEAPPPHVVPTTFFYYPKPFASSFVPIARLLRGPPFAA
jgi:hypothetical protein